MHEDWGIWGGSGPPLRIQVGGKGVIIMIPNCWLPGVPPGPLPPPALPLRVGSRYHEGQSPYQSKNDNGELTTYAVLSNSKVRSLQCVIVIPKGMILTWIKLTGKERMITELRWRMHGVAIYSMAALLSPGGCTRNRLSKSGT